MLFPTNISALLSTSAKHWLNRCLRLAQRARKARWQVEQAPAMIVTLILNVSHSSLSSKNPQMNVSLFAFCSSHCRREHGRLWLWQAPTDVTLTLITRETWTHSDANLARNESGPLREESMTNSPSGAQGNLGTGWIGTDLEQRPGKQWA